MSNYFIWHVWLFTLELFYEKCELLGEKTKVPGALQLMQKENLEKFDL